MIKTFLTLILTFIFASPTIAEERDTVTTSPDGQYNITQHALPENDNEGWFSTTLHFQDESKPDVDLTLRGGEFKDIAWRSAARYFISPDAQWLLRIQHLGGGTNWAFLYRVERDGDVRRKDISRLVFKRIEQVLHSSVTGKTQIELGSWDIASGSVVLDVSYQPIKSNVQQPWLYFKAIYHLNSGKLVVIKARD